MPYYCPNCSEPCDANAPECAKCGASFGSGSAWKPTAERGSGQINSGVPLELRVPLGWFFVVLAIVLVLLAVFFTFTCKPGACSGVPLAFVLFPCVALFSLGTGLIRKKR